MTAPRRRKLTILDGMILVAAAACGLALSRAIDEAPGPIATFDQNWLGRNANGGVRVTAAVPFLLVFTPAVLFMRLRRPRPRWRRLCRQPGMAACCAAAIPSALALLQVFYLDWYGRHGFVCCRVRLLWDRSFDAGLWVLAAWLALALSGRRSSGRSAIDWLGRLVGAGWLLILTVQLLGRI